MNEYDYPDEHAELETVKAEVRLRGTRQTFAPKHSILERSSHHRIRVRFTGASSIAQQLGEVAKAEGTSLIPAHGVELLIMICIQEELNEYRIEPSTSAQSRIECEARRRSWGGLNDSVFDPVELPNSLDAGVQTTLVNI